MTPRLWTLAGIAAVVLLGPPLLLLALSTPARLTLTPPVHFVGTTTPVTAHVESPHGLRQLNAFLEQNGQRFPVHSTSRPSHRLGFLRLHEPAQDLTFPVGTQQAKSVKDGPAKLIVEAQANDFRGATTTTISDVQINTQPPMVSADGAQHYINQGGSELVTFTVSGYWTEAGVRVGKYTFRSFPLPGQQNEPGQKGGRFSLFAYPWDLPPNVTPVVYVRNPTGAEATASFWFKLFPKKFRTREVPIDNWVQRVVDQIEPGGTGDPAARFVSINSKLRQQNNAVLADLRKQTAEKLLWSEPFVQLGNSKVEAQFADDRSYTYHGKKVDEQMHLGFDLSVNQKTPVAASNSGHVLWAGPLGIYGNCIVLDHGYGLQSIYGHLSEIGVKVGDNVPRGQAMGKTGSTGLAAGDHLHYSMQVDGVQVNPVEWWDPHWIHDRIFSKVHP